MLYAVYALVFVLLFDAAVVAAMYRLGVARDQVRKVQLERQFSQHTGHDLSELGGLSQSNHVKGNAA